MKKILISISIAFLLSYGLGGRNAFAQKVDKYKAEGIAVSGTGSTTGFSGYAATALTPGTQYIFNYHVFGN